MGWPSTWRWTDWQREGRGEWSPARRRDAPASHTADPDSRITSPPMGPPERPDPDALLARVVQDEARSRRGRLKLFFGAAPGVGKTYTMLEAARAARAEGE